MKQYLDLLYYIRSYGVRKPTRAVLESTGQNIDAWSVFGYQMTFNLELGFPILTTKRMPFKAIVHELIWLLSGATNINYLLENNVHIWDQWANALNEVGPSYGFQWRSWRGSGRVIDQIANVIRDIEEVKHNPLASAARRLIVTAWNPDAIDQVKLPPCHCFFQFNVTNGRLSCHLYQRSADAFLGVPFNITSYALLTHLVAHVTGLKPGEFVHSFGDLHIYDNHMEQVKTQMARTPEVLPELVIRRHIERIDKIAIDDFELRNYKSHSKLSGEVAI